MVCLLRLIGTGSRVCCLYLNGNGDIVTNPPQHMHPTFHKNIAELFVSYPTAEPWSSRMAIVFHTIEK